MLQPHEPPPVTIERSESRSPFFFTCDHASNRVPAVLGDLGLPAAEFERHIAWDIGALGVARALSATFDATLVAAGYSRLVIDCNRHCWREDSIPTVSETTMVPGNVGLGADERAARRIAIWQPYHDAIVAALAARAARRQATLYIAVHSFTPVYKGEARPWHIAVLSNRDRRVANYLLERLHREPGLLVGDNIPYRLTDEGDYGVPVHAERAGIPHALIEIRQDQIAGPAGQQAYAARLAPLLDGAARTLGIER